MKAEIIQFLTQHHRAVVWTLGIAGAYIVLIAIMLIAMLRTKPGYEDTTGFHEGNEKS